MVSSVVQVKTSGRYYIYLVPHQPEILGDSFVQFATVGNWRSVESWLIVVEFDLVCTSRPVLIDSTNRPSVSVLVMKF